MTKTLEKATFGGGCFWGVEEIFRSSNGVTKTTVGYMGGTTSQPSYEEVCTARTGHAEVVQVVFDPSLTSYDALLDIFFANHNPTTLNRQGPDVGSQYRSAIFPHSQDQAKAAKDKITALQNSKRFKKDIVTTIETTQSFWPAEEDHQQYLSKRGLSSCRI